jgi:NNP family nitrate/nitrite transporter-like MFS transporter
MAKFKEFLKSGHPPTLFASFLYFDFCFAVWVLNGAMAPFISESFHLTPAQKGFMISVPILAGALMRFPLGVLAQYIGRKSAALVEMGLIMVAMIYGYMFVDTYNDVLRMGILLGIAGASFGVALSLGSGWFPAKYKGLAMGIAGAGNSGTALAVLFAPPLAARYGWQNVYGIAAITMLLPFTVMAVFAKEPPDREHQTFKEHISCLFDKDGWVFNLVYIITFGGFIGLSSFLPTYFYDQFGVSKIEAGQLTMLAALMGSGLRVVGGYISDRKGGITTLGYVFGVVIVTLIFTGLQTSVIWATLGFMLCFAALGAGNGALFQLVPLRWPTTTAIAGSMIGEIGALGGAIIPNAMGLSKQYTGTYFYGFFSFCILAVIAFFVMYVAQKKWTKTWVGKGGLAKVDTTNEKDMKISLVVGVENTTSGSLPENQGAYKNIIYPVGNSELADKGAEVASQMCKMSGAQLTLLYVEEKWHGAEGLATDSPEWQQIRDTWIKEGQEILTRESERFKKLGVKKIKIELRQGQVASEVIACAEENQADMIVLTSHQRSPIGKLLMGSRTFDIFKKATCPILRIVR